MTQIQTKICSKCLVKKSKADYYSKGNRIDSRCKECVKSIKKTKYISKQEQFNFSSLMDFFKLVHTIEIQQLNRANSKLQEVISKCQTVSLR